MKIERERMRQIAEATLSVYDLSGLDIDPKKAIPAIEEEIWDDARELNEPEVLERRWGNCGIPGTKPEDFAEEILEMGPGGYALCGIRHLGMNLEKPFVQVRASFPFTSAEQVREAYRRFLKERFSVFRPLWMQVVTTTGEGSEAGGALTLAGRAKRMLRATEARQDTALELDAPDDDSYFSWYQESYDKFHEENPETRDWVQANDLELMRECRELGLLRLVAFEGKPLGIIAAERAPFLGCAGIYVVEILLEKSARGKGWGSVMQRQFVAECVKPEEVVWGLIDRKNEASLATALANGRKVVCGEVFVRVD